MSDGGYLVRLHSLQRKTNMINKALQSMASEISILKYESYQDYYRKHEKYYEWQDSSSQMDPFTPPNKRRRQTVTQHHITESASQKRLSERRSTRIANNPRINLNENIEGAPVHEDVGLAITELTGSLVPPIQRPIRNSDWTLTTIEDKYRPDILPDAEEFGFIPTPLKTLLNTKQMKQILRSFDE
ncbi:hypothetical protein, no similarity [Maudiozyma barnettii]|uniref:Uncharacterized protein n=1 Tax=Maudiozyma barnettii TaxID=61262 RepID=A0A8H2VCF9_9SACH|nr:hypothetical protein, no similarity [Kazachstania barnettii]CAB4252683.1 hypothetical protein, no similarity [Kazachstania barnettii]CAD1780473.1 hypothetical protein, no similarity [Kazachstania barnettii]